VPTPVHARVHPNTKNLSFESRGSQAREFFILEKMHFSLDKPPRNSYNRRMEHSKTTQTIPDYWERFQLRAILTVSLGYLASLVPLRAIRASRETRRESSTVTLGGLPLLYTSGAGLSSKIDTPDQSIFRYWAFSMGYKRGFSGPPSFSTPQGRKTLHTLYNRICTKRPSNPYV